MKYMLMMFGSAAGMAESASPDWIKEMIAFMRDLDRELTESGEMISNEGLTDGSTATTVRFDDGAVITTDGPFAEDKDSLIGFWIVDVDSEERALEISGRIVKYSRVLEVRRVGEGPPDA